MTTPDDHLTPLESPPAPEVETPQAPAPESAEPASPPTSSAEGSSQTPAPEDPPKAETPKEPAKSAREQLIAKLTGEEDETPEEPAKPAEPPAPQDKAEPPAPGTPEPKKADAPPEQDDLTELTNDTAKAMKPGEARRKINRLIERVKTTEPLAAGYREIVDLCQKNGITPEDYRAWVALGLGINQGNPDAVKQLDALRAKLPGATQAAPSAPPADLDTWLNKQVDDLEISKSAAAELRAKLTGGAPAKPAAAPAPAPAPAAPPQDHTASARDRALASINKIADEVEQRIGAARFKELEPQIKAALGQHKGVHPDAWAVIFRATVDQLVAKAPKPASVNPSLRPGGTSAPASQPQFKSERERIIHQYTG